jgi:hypoxanthine phosphoribosyltransferase
MVPPRRIFDHCRTWRLHQDALGPAITLLADTIVRDHQTVEHVVGVARGGTTPARLLAATLGVRAHTVHARHNATDATHHQATGDVQVDLEPLIRSLDHQRLTGRVLLVDDICGSGATLRRVHDELDQLAGGDIHVITAVLCRNTGGAVTVPTYWIWTVSDWVVFPWEQLPPGQDTTPLPHATEIVRDV